MDHTNHDACLARAREIEQLVTLALGPNAGHQPHTERRLAELVSWPCRDVRVAAVRGLEWIGANAASKRTRRPEVLAALIEAAHVDDGWTEPAAISALRGGSDEHAVALVAEAQVHPRALMQIAAREGLDGPAAVDYAFAMLRRTLHAEPRAEALPIAAGLSMALWPRAGLAIAAFAEHLGTDAAAFACAVAADDDALQTQPGHLHLDLAEALQGEEEVVVVALQLWHDDALVFQSAEDVPLVSVGVMRAAWLSMAGTAEAARAGASYWTAAIVALLARAGLRSGLPRTVTLGFADAAPLFVGWLDVAGLTLWRDA